MQPSIGKQRPEDMETSRFSKKIESILGPINTAHGTRIKEIPFSEKYLRGTVEKGLPFATFEVVRSEFDISQKQLSEILEISSRTISRRKEMQRFTPVESDRLYRIIRIVKLAEETFGDSDKATEWMKTPNRGLGGDVPLYILNTDIGTQQVEEILQRINYGIYS
jgi:putative toxin-antitoxin system antitoxin component (TIGR02293 family)